jgi:hypothetical protein
VVPLEVWDLLTEHGPLWQCRDLPDWPALLLRAIEDLREGRARRAGGEPLPDECRRIDFLFVGGGGARRAGLVEVLAGGRLPCHISSAGAFVGEAGGFALLRRAGLAGAVVDLGQTALKVSTPGRRLVVPRPLWRLPLTCPAEGTEEPRGALRDFVAAAIRQVPGPADGVVLALPCEVDDDRVPGPCSYVGLEGDRVFVADVLRRAGLSGVTALVLNDAELAAASARLSPHVPPDRTTLVLTLGFGVGAALLLPGDRHAR